MKPRVGQRLGSEVCETELIVVRASADDLDLTCGGRPVAELPVERSGSTDDTEPSLLGKRYVHEQSGLELLCTKGGAGTLRVAGEALAIKDAKNLPSSD